MSSVSKMMKELADREAIRDVLLRYCRGSDRCDTAMVLDAYWPDAHDDHMEFSGTPEEFVDYSTPILQTMRFSQHQLINVLICIDGNTAEVESYFQGYHSIPSDNGDRHDVIAAGRYLDIFEKRIDEWRILKRFVIVDWFREFPDTGNWNAGPFGMGDKVKRGDLKPHDLSYKFFKNL